MLKVSHLHGFNARRTAAAALPTPTFQLDAALGIFDAISGGSPVTTHGATVARWEDQSGNAYNFAANATTSTWPALQTSGGPNSLPFLLFDASNDRFSRTAMTIPAVTVFAVLKLTTSAGWHHIIAQANAGSNLNQPFELRSGSFGSTDFRFVGGGNGSASFGTTNWRLLTGIHEGSGGNTRCSMNGTTALPTVAGTWPATTGSDLWIGARADNGTQLNAGMAEMRFYNSALTLAEIQAVELDLGAKHGITITH